MRIGNREFDTRHHTYVMGILNITPDSFSDGGKWMNREDALRHAGQMIEDGADIIDIGGESTRPGYSQVGAEEEMERVLPVIERLKAEFDIPLSLDTCKSKVAEAGIRAGADLINDIWGLKYDEKMAEVIAAGKTACCLMHNRREAQYDRLLPDVLTDLAETVKLAEKAGIAKEKIVLDPGIGFGKTYEQNLQLLHYMEELHCFGYPLLLGTSRKSVIGLTLDLPPQERLEGTLVTTALAVEKRYSFVRVHDVKENVRAIKMAEALRDCADD